MKLDIRAALEQRKMSQADLAKSVGASEGAISRLLQPDCVASRLLPDICALFDLELPPFLLEGEGEGDIAALRELGRLYPDMLHTLGDIARQSLVKH